MAEETVIIEEKDEGQFNFKNMGKAIAKFKWWVIGATAVGALGGFLAFKVGLNPAREELVSKFSYSINAKPKNFVITEKTTNKDFARQPLYLSDGSLFEYSDVISESRLLAVQEANQEAFGKINISKMVKNGGIKITKASYTDNTTGEEVYEYPARYTISAVNKYFKSEQQGKDFIKAVLEYELDIAKTANNNYEVENFLSDSSASNFGLYVNNLNKQYSAIKDCYSSLLADFATSSIANKDGLTLNQINTSFQVTYSYGSYLDELEGELYTKHLVNLNGVSGDKAAVKAVLMQRANAYKESVRSNLGKIDDYQQAIKDLANTSIIDDGTSALTQELIDLNKKVLDIKELNAFYKKEIANLGFTVPNVVTLDNIDSITYPGDSSGEGAIQSLMGSESDAWKAECSEFVLTLAETAGDLKQDRTTAGDVYGYVQNKYNNQVNFYTPGVAKMQGHLSSLIGVAAGLALGFIASTLVVTIVYISKKEKKESEEKKD